jgi:hypothetical protein
VSTANARAGAAWPGLVYRILNLVVFASFALRPISGPLWSQSTDSQADKRTHVVGTLEDISGGSLTLKSDSGQRINVAVDDETVFIRVAPGETDLKNGAAIEPTDLLPGDRVLVQGYRGANQDVAAVRVISIKKADVAEREEHSRQDWQKRGIGGIVHTVDPQNHQIELSGAASGAVIVLTSAQTQFWRYADQSVKFSDVGRAHFDQIRPGDQLRVLGDRAAESNTVSAEQVVFGSFRNIAGTVAAIGPQKGEIQISDLLTKSSVDVRVPDSAQIRKLPPYVAQALASLVKKDQDETAAPPHGEQAAGSKSAHKLPDLQHLLANSKKGELNKLQKGDAVMIVSTLSAVRGEDKGVAPAGPVVAITMLTGVEPILTASPAGTGAASLLSGWDISGAPTETARR